MFFTSNPGPNILAWHIAVLSSSPPVDVSAMPPLLVTDPFLAGFGPIPRGSLLLLFDKHPGPEARVFLAWDEIHDGHDGHMFQL